MAFHDLRSFLDALEAEGDLVRIHHEVDAVHEIAAHIRRSSDTDGPALLFEKVRCCGVRAAGGLFASRRKAVRALEVGAAEAVEKFVRAMEAPIPTRRVDSGPCKDVVLTGNDAGLTGFPICTYSELDSGPFITAAVAISRDPEDGGRNASIYRFELKGPHRLGVLAEAPHHLGIHIQKAEQRNVPLPVALAVGVAPAVLMATQWEAPYGVDELGLAGALLGRAVEVVRCETSDLEVPAAAEIIIEGRILPGVRETEGPFGEYTGYYTPAYPKPVLEITAISHRRDPIFQAMLTGMPTTENHVLKMIPMEASCLVNLRRRFPGVTAVHFPGAGGVGLMGVVALKVRAKNEARGVLATMLGSQGNKLVIVVDDDIDVLDMQQVMWAVCTRCQPDRDVIILPRMPGWQLDPSAPEPGTYAVMGINATRPVGEKFGTVARVPGVESVPPFR
ncbi:MAG: UbiD family decarboxylase [Gammaproteobacteria bacterium]|nr:UbiD family decarboxylase [Gammaproteobacteria bacterium]